MVVGPNHIHARVGGTGPNLLLIAGLNGRASFWDAVVSEWGAGHRVARFDQRGCGATPDDGADWSIEMLAGDAFAVAEAAFGSAPFAVIGHSTGGAIAQCMAAMRPDTIRTAVLSGTWSEADAYMRALFALRVELLTRAPELDAVLGDLMRIPPESFRTQAALPPLDPGVAIRRIRALLGHRGPRWFSAVRCPVLIVAAGDDWIVPPHLTQALHSQLPQSELVMLETGGHFFPQTRAAEFCGRVGAWLDQTG